MEAQAVTSGLLVEVGKVVDLGSAQGAVSFLANWSCNSDLLKTFDVLQACRREGVHRLV